MTTQWNDRWYIRGFEFDRRGSPYILYRESYSRTPYEGALTYDGRYARVLDHGPIAIVSDDVTDVRPTSWGALKSRYR